MKTLLSTDVELFDEHENEEATFSVYFDTESETFIAEENGGDAVYKYKLKDTIENICKNHRDSILEYSIGTYSRSEQVQLIDIFLHAGYISQITE